MKILVLNGSPRSSGNVRLPVFLPEASTHLWAGKKAAKRKKQGPGPRIQAEAPLQRIVSRTAAWISVVKLFFGFCSQKPANPREY